MISHTNSAWITQKSEKNWSEFQCDIRFIESRSMCGAGAHNMDFGNIQVPATTCEFFKSYTMNHIVDAMGTHKQLSS